MKRLLTTLLPICIIAIDASSLATSTFAAEVLVKSGAPSRINHQSTASAQIRKDAARNTRKLANTSNQTVQMRHIDPSKRDRTPVYDLPEVSRNNPRDPNGPIDSTDYRPPIAEDLKTPLPEGIDPGKLSPGRGDPREAGGRSGPQPRGNQRGGSFSRWIPGETQPDGTPLWQDDETRERWSNNPPPDMDDHSESNGDEFVEWLDKYDGGDPNLSYGPPLVPGDGSSSDTSNDDDIVTAEEMDKIEREANANTSEDPEPEGDDPDEMRSRMASEQRGVTGGARTGQGPINPVQPSTNQGKRKPGEWLPGESTEEHGRRVTSGTPLPEDGGPDESSSASSSQALNKERFNRGMVAKPTPDAGQGGGPTNPGPNAIQGEINLPDIGMAASPAPEAGEGGGTTPPRPEM